MRWPEEWGQSLSHSSQPGVAGTANDTTSTHNRSTPREQANEIDNTDEIGKTGDPRAD
jgi:hypothetical protein